MTWTMYLASVTSALIGRRLTQFTSGRSKVLRANINPVSVVASTGIPLPARVPTAAEHHSVATVLSPLMLVPSFRITSAPKEAKSGYYIGNDVHSVVGTK